MAAVTQDETFELREPLRGLLLANGKVEIHDGGFALVVDSLADATRLAESAGRLLALDDGRRR